MGLMAKIPGIHPAGLGSIYSMEGFFFTFNDKSLTVDLSRIYKLDKSSNYTLSKQSQKISLDYKYESVNICQFLTQISNVEIMAKTMVV